ncbi:MAG: DegT/DnrJ/EryC1/StrS family aminotransferase [Thermodesulfobacteriota bacterium]|jgi:perosamine synthetase
MKKIPVSAPWIDEEDVQRATEVVRSGWLSRGPEVEEFEKKVAEFLGAGYGIAVSSGTAAVEVALRALDLEGKEIITSIASCVPTLNAILHAGCKPVFVDVEDSTYNIDVEQIEAHISDQTGALLPVHLYGHPCNMGPILDLANKYHLPIIEDCAIAMGAKYQGKYVSTLGAAGCFSFYANKMITTGEGGMVVTSDPQLAQQARIIRHHGQHPDRPFYHILYGHNFKLSNLQAAIGLSQMNKLQKSIERRRDHAAILTEKLADLQEIQLPREMPYAFHIYFSYPILLKTPNRRDRLCRFLADNGIETRPMFGPMSTQPFFEERYGPYPEQFLVAEQIGLNGFYVSCSPLLQPEDLDYMAVKIREGLYER